jgi:ABC-type nitrate/sulfonate/bicarbonate transport system permease component
MVAAQIRMETPTLLALMIIAAIVGFIIDRGFLYLTRLVARWKYVQAT